MPERSTKQFVCRYFHDNSWWGINVAAYDWRDAEIRAQKLGLQLDGEMGAIIQARPGTGILVRCLTALRNLISVRRSQ